MSLVQIRPVELTDGPAVQLYASDARVAETTNIPQPYPADGGAAFVLGSVNAWAARSHFPFAITYDGEFCGVVTLNRPDFERKTIQVDYWVAQPFWGRSIGTEAVRLAVEYARTNFGTRTVFSACLDRNPASKRVLEKNGFRSIGAEINTGHHGQKILGELVQRFQLD